MKYLYKLILLTILIIQVSVITHSILYVENRNTVIINVFSATLVALVVLDMLNLRSNKIK